MRAPKEQFRAGKRLWSASDEARLRRLYPDTPTADLAVLFRRSLSAISQRAQILGLKKSAAYLASPAACRLRRPVNGQHPGAAHWFPKGNVPANKGLRRPGWAPGRMAATQFKRGARPHTWVPVGTEVWHDGYLKVKVDDDRRRPSRYNWRFVHVLLWETTHGPVPRGHAVVFANGDRSAIRLDNLELVPRRELMRRNTVHRLPAPLKSAIHLLGQLKRRIREKDERAQEQD